MTVLNSLKLDIPIPRFKLKKEFFPPEPRKTQEYYEDLFNAVEESSGDCVSWWNPDTASWTRVYKKALNKVVEVSRGPIAATDKVAVFDLGKNKMYKYTLPEDKLEKYYLA